MAIQIQLRHDTASNWSSANPILAIGEVGIETDTNQIKVGNGVNTWSALPYGGIQGPAQTNSLQDFGSGEDGNVTISAGTTNLVSDVYYNNLTITGSGQLRTNGYRVFVKNNLDLSNAGANAITASGLNGLNGVLNGAGSGGSASYVAAIFGAPTAGGNGGIGVSGAGAQAALTTGTTPSNGGNSGNGGAGGNGSGGLGGLLRAAATATVPQEFAFFTMDIVRGITLMQASPGGPGGSSGGGDGTNLGRGGGGGGSGAGILVIWAKNIIKSASTPANCITSIGGFGGNGATATVGNVGGGGGGAGGGGGYILMYYQTVSGPTVTNMLNASGGDSGSGGNGFGTGIGGQGGQGGAGGRIRVNQTLTQVSGITVGVTAALGNLGVGNVGGAAGAGGLSRRDF